MQPPPWINNEYIELRNKVGKTKTKAEKSKDPKQWESFKGLRNTLNNLAVKLKKEYFEDSIREAVKDSKKLWSTLRKIIPNKTDRNGINSVNDNNEMITNTKDIANCFNTYFSNIGESLAAVFPENPEDTGDQDDTARTGEFRFMEVTADQVYEQLSKMPTGKATGLDDISPRLLKAGAPFISQPIAYIMNLGLRSGVVPTKWKQSRVTFPSL
jgi:hypothetical protein